MAQFALTLIHTVALARWQTELRKLKPFQRFSPEPHSLSLNFQTVKTVREIGWDSITGLKPRCE
jgi:hypothetical protein